MRMIDPVSYVRQRVAACVHLGVRALETILHLGVHRTATTTFQDYLDRNVARLEGSGVAVWTPSAIRGGLFSGMVRPPHETSVVVERSTHLIGLTCARLRRKNTRQLIVSEENMIGTIRVNLRSQSLYSELTPRLARFGKAFGHSCDRILLSIRSYETFWASSIAFGATTGFPALDEQARMRIVAHPRGWRDVIKEIHALFPKAEISVLPYEAFGGNVGETLDAATGYRGLSAGMVDQPVRHNESPAGRASPFDTQTQLNFRRRYDKDLAWLANGGGGFARLLAPQSQTDMDEIGTERLATIQRGAMTGGHYGTIRRME